MHDTVSKHQGVSVHTGFPNPAIDTQLRSLDLNQLLIQNSASTYMMEVLGNDWQSVGIFDGDIAIVDRAVPITVTDVVVWHYEGDFAVSARARMPRTAIVFGVVTSVIHQYRRKHEI